MVSERPTDDAVLLLTRKWLERAVVGLSLCPFAKGVMVNDQIRYVVSPAETSAALLSDLRAELRALSGANPDVVDTTLLIAPHVLEEFLDFNDFLRLAGATVEKLGLTGTLQIASFHPEYVFGDLDSSDAANSSNRSPYPILHLLREASVTHAVERFPDAAKIFERNVALLRELGHDGFQRVLAGSAPPAEESPRSAPPTLTRSK